MVDMKMPELSGAELLQIIEQEYPGSADDCDQRLQ